MMHNIIKYGFGAFAAVLLAGCSYDDDGAAIAPKPGTQGKGEKGYGISVGTAEVTRAQLDGSTWKWSPRENVGFFIADAGASTPFASNRKLTGLNTAASTAAEFEGEITESQIGRMNASGMYDYYSYYPYSSAVTGTAVPFTIPAEVTTSAGNLDVPVFMTANVTGKGALTYLLDDGTQYFTGERVDFRFNQALSYMDLYLALNLMSQDIKKITVTCPQGYPIAGAVSVDVTSGAVTAVSGSSNQMVINIPAGINVGSQDVRVAVLPQTFPAGTQLKFTLQSDFNTFETTIDVGGKTFEAGRNYRLGLRTSFEISFLGVDDAPRSGEESSFWCGGYYVWSDNISLQSFGIRFYHGWGGNNDMIRINLNVNNTYNAATIPVKVTLACKTNGLVDSDKHLQYAAVSPTATSFSGTKVQMEHSGNITGNSGYGDKSFNMSFTSANSAFGLKSMFAGIDATYIHVRSIRIEFTGGIPQ